MIRYHPHNFHLILSLSLPRLTIAPHNMTVLPYYEEDGLWDSGPSFDRRYVVSHDDELHSVGEVRAQQLAMGEALPDQSRIVWRSRTMPPWSGTRAALTVPIGSARTGRLVWPVDTVSCR